MKKTLKNAITLVLALSLALGVSFVPSEAKSVKGVVVPLVAQNVGMSSVSSWVEPNNFSSDFNNYLVSADIYIPVSAFNKDGGSIFIDSWVSFWFGDLGMNGYLENDTTICVGYDFEQKNGFYKGLVRGTDEEIKELSYVKDIQEIDDMIKVKIVDAPVLPIFRGPEWDPEIEDYEKWKGDIPTTGDACPLIRIGTDRSIDTKYVVTNASVKIGGNEYKTDYSGSESIAGYYSNDEYIELPASTFNTKSLSVANTSVKIKKKKNTTVKVTTMFDGDKVKVSSSKAKVAKATYKSGKVTIKGLKKGKAIITVKANGKTKKIKVTVTK